MSDESKVKEVVIEFADKTARELGQKLADLDPSMSWGEAWTLMRLFTKNMEPWFTTAYNNAAVKIKKSKE